MRQRYAAVFASVLAGCLALWALWGQHSAGQGGSKKPGKADAEWEYCQLLRDPDQDTIEWHTANRSVVASGWKKLADQMNAPVGGDDLTQDNYRMVVFNFLGSQGWELTTSYIISPGKRGVWHHLHTFRRKR